MLVIHGLWAHGSSYLWAEDSALPAAAPPRAGRPSRAPRPHPSALQASGLARALARLPEPAAGLVGQAVDDELTLRLPSGTDGPLASPELIRPPGQDGAGTGRPGGRRVSLVPWRVPALAFEPAPAIDLLTVLSEPGAFSGEVIGGGSARYLAAVARLAADLAARGRVLPALRAEDGGLRTRCWPACTEPATTCRWSRWTPTAGSATCSPAGPTAASNRSRRRAASRASCAPIKSAGWRGCPSSAVSALAASSPMIGGSARPRRRCAWS